MKFRYIVSVCFVLFMTFSVYASPQNLSDLKNEVQHFYENGAYEIEVRTALHRGRFCVEQHHNPSDKWVAVVDVDETALLYYDVIKAHNFGVPFELFDDIIAKYTPKPNEQLKVFLKEIQERGALIYFVSRRDHKFQSLTEKQLKAAGFGFDNLILADENSKNKNNQEFKRDIRESLVDKGYKVIINIGDQPSDVAGGHAVCEILFPNPLYRVS